MKEVNFIIVSSFENEENFGTDPYGYYVELDGEILFTYGDDYHDKGQDKCYGFIHGYVLGKGIKKGYKIEHQERADFETIYG